MMKQVCWVYWALALLLCPKGAHCTIGTDKTTVPLFGDVEKLGYVYVKAGVQSSGQRVFRMVIDTSTRLSLLPCTGCTAATCGEKRLDNLIDREHETSPIICADFLCPEPSRNCSMILQGKTDECVLQEAFPGVGNVEGVYVDGKLNFSDFVSWLPYGCMQSMPKDFQDLYVDGILGAGLDSDVFKLGSHGWSICIAPPGFYGGSMSMGNKMEYDNEEGNNIWLEVHTGHPKDKTKFWSSDHKIGMKQVKLSSDKIVMDDHFHAVVRTASPFSWVPKKLFQQLRTALFAHCDENCHGLQRVTGDAQSLACFQTEKKSGDDDGESKDNADNMGGMDMGMDMGGDSDKNNLRHDGEEEEHDHNNDHTMKQEQQHFAVDLPNITFVFPGEGRSKFEMPITPSQYIYPHEDALCIGIMANDNDDENDDMVVLGINILRGWDIGFDNSGTEKKIRFRTCDKYEKDDKDSHSDSSNIKKQLPDQSVSTHAGVGAFFGMFILTSTFLFCTKLICCTTTKYQALDEFGSGDMRTGGEGEGGPPSYSGVGIQMTASGKFSIGSIDEDDEDEDELLDPDQDHSDGGIPSDFVSSDEEEEEDQLHIEENGSKSTTNGFHDALQFDSASDDEI